MSSNHLPLESGSDQGHEKQTLDRCSSNSFSSGSLTTAGSHQGSSGRLLNNNVEKLMGFFWETKKESKSLKRKGGGMVWYQKKKTKRMVFVVGLIGFFFIFNWFMIVNLQDGGEKIDSFANSSKIAAQKEFKKLSKRMRSQYGVYGRMLALAAHALAEGQNKREPKDLWKEPVIPASVWRPCADQRNWNPSGGNNGYIMVTANGGMNQQRVAICNAVVVARLLNASLVIPKFMYSSVWRDVSQFSDIYGEEHFIDHLAPDIRIVKELPNELQSLDLEAIGSVVTDVDLPKESKPSFYLKYILPILFKNRVVHFLGFANRLAFDPIPFQLQRLRCRCNFHALQFVPKIQETGALLLRRLRKHAAYPGPLDRYLVGPHTDLIVEGKKVRSTKASKYLALHLRFEIDMVAHSLCEFGGGEEERLELEAYREIHFPALTLLKKTTKLPSPAELRTEGLCPLAPEEAVLMLAALGFKRKTRIFVAGAQIYGGSTRLSALNSLYPYLVTKENLLSAAELEPFKNFSSQLAALDFIGCTAADAFAMTDSGSQLSSLVSGYRIYHGAGKMPTIRPNKRRLSAIFMKNSTIEWKIFEQRVRKAVRQTKHVQTRPKARSVYRYPRCKESIVNQGGYTKKESESVKRTGGKKEFIKFSKMMRSQYGVYGRMLALASHALAEVREQRFMSRVIELYRLNCLISLLVLDELYGIEFSYTDLIVEGKGVRSTKASKYLALHLRFEIDMVAHSLCEFGGGEEERLELEAYREIHFPAPALLKKTKLPSPAELRTEGLCPLAPEEAVLMLAALGFNRKTRIFVAGGQIYGGSTRLSTLNSLYSYLVTKENLLSAAELEPFKNFSSQTSMLVPEFFLYFFGCLAASQFKTLV
ncbi:hypothetical protein LWI28_010800 [Acer negundo]|uniref:O-fucosyltransferase family protein n=1 Tax=Acer negundo TaxID=4023 RepID=A0AAD5JG99_ACENE|nr:hypothetical protein LWI28_010800 [Acer negundo]